VESSSSLLPALVFVHGESFEWNSGNPYDGSVLAAQGNLVVITLNYRLGILGKLVFHNFYLFTKIPYFAHMSTYAGRQKPQAPTPQAPVRNRQTRKVANAKVRVG